LVGYSNIIKSYLQSGNQLEIVLEGYASPLSNPEYNQKLSSRRVNSVINYFSTFSGGSLKKYIKSGQLKISVQPHGEINSNVNDDEKNAASIYSIDASRERKVVIKDIIILNNAHYKKQ
jgi:outer membrane protein OmpA-like peptidoglycan-associated protein